MKIPTNQEIKNEQPKVGNDPVNKLAYEPVGCLYNTRNLKANRHVGTE
jgi:hypothetical protein